MTDRTDLPNRNVEAPPNDVEEWLGKGVASGFGGVDRTAAATHDAGDDRHDRPHSQDNCRGEGKSGVDEPDHDDDRNG